MTRNTRLTLAAIVVLMLVVAGLLAVDRRDEVPAAKTAGGTVDTAMLVRDDSHRLTTAADGKVTLVEFLDFECEACGAAYPAVKQVLAAYEGRITFVVRYFPIASHPNADLAARTAQAAANQGRFADMYRLLFENQTVWGHKEQPQTEVFLGYARDLGLDVDQFQRDLDDPATAARVARDRADGEAAGVQGTPTFFLNGRPLSDLRSKDDLTGAIDAALAG
ncbi:DsbA family protein [Micromonospora endolithica]|uniref:Disulfide bond formation protein DsbA n=1 Tax=Micromonospora endolithica TaxID=230091 RepID=A0A3A9ZQA3_9ACTN|nr:thioredoxin domain-containing protein [Micromonospora endolithica]RKN50361.1 disulfide bond formation protein DsbA [Micromonospora endolithica]TWJ20969.1 protein-disulfide isomerase [Micromonospora endolithica]